MNRLFTYALILMFSIAYSFENFAYIFKSLNTVTAYFDLDDESKAPGSDDNEKKDDKFKSFDEHIFKNAQPLTAAEPLGLEINRNTYFHSDGYSQVIYSPPDFV